MQQIVWTLGSSESKHCMDNVDFFFNPPHFQSKCWLNTGWILLSLTDEQEAKTCLFMLSISSISLTIFCRIQYFTNSNRELDIGKKWSFETSTFYCLEEQS